MKITIEDDVEIIDDIEVIDPSACRKYANPVLDFIIYALNIIVSISCYYVALYLLSDVLDDIF